MLRRTRLCFLTLLVVAVCSSAGIGQNLSRPQPGQNLPRQQDLPKQKDERGYVDYLPGGRRQVAIPLAAVDGQGNPASNLRPEDLRLFADGVEERVVGIARQDGAPLRVAVLLDASASQEKVLPAAKQAALELLSTLLGRRSGDRAAVISFTNKPTLVQDETDDLDTVRRAVESVRFVAPPGYAGGGLIVGTPTPASSMQGSTALWDAIAYACDGALGASASGDVRRAVVVISDGSDTSSRLNLEGAVQAASRAGVAVYSVGIGDSNFDGVDTNSLQKISERTGGRAFFPKKSSDLSAAFDRIRRDLLSRYVVTFDAKPAAAGRGSAHKLRVEVINQELRRRGVELAYPRTFYDAMPSAKK